MKLFLIPEANIEEKQELGIKAISIQKLQMAIEEELANYKELLLSEYKFALTPRLNKNFRIFGWNEFNQELEKQKIVLNLNEKEQLQNWIKQKQKNIISLNDKLEDKVKQIDEKVYKLYGLTKEEINIIEEEI